MIKEIFSYFEILPGPLGGYFASKSHLTEWTRCARIISSDPSKALPHTMADRIEGNVFNN